jgi:predicted phosphodiesterase
MHILVLSDLHLESSGPYSVPTGLASDVVVLAGDIHNPGVRGIEWAAKTFDGKPVIYVPGNHEFYDEEMEAQLMAMRQAAQGTNVHVLSRDAVVIDGVRFLGTTLWTDFELPVAGRSDISRALEVANRDVVDFQVIEVADPSIPRHRGDDVVRRRLCAQDTLAMHRVDREWLRRELEANSAGPTVVVTHHAPSRGSVAKKYASDWVTPSFVSDLPYDLFDGNEQRAGPLLWVHGHTHTAFDYQVGQCRVVSNPRGYRMRDSTWENVKFNPGLVVEV